MEKSTLSTLVVVGGMLLAGIFTMVVQLAAKRKSLKEQQAESDEGMCQFDAGHAASPPHRSRQSDARN